MPSLVVAILIVAWVILMLLHFLSMWVVLVVIMTLMLFDKYVVMLVFL